MSSLRPTATSRRNWESLTLDQRAQVTAWAAAHLTRNASKYRDHLGVGVVGFSAGFREVHPDRRTASQLVEESVVTAFVKHRWTRAEERAAKPEAWVPAEVKLRVPIPKPLERTTKRVMKRALFEADVGGRRRVRRRVVSIPLDVVQAANPRAEGALPRAPEAQKLFILSPRGKGTIGVACALVRLSDPGHGGLWLLGCHHVIWRSLFSTNLSADSHVRVWCGRTPPQDSSAAIAEIGVPSGRAVLSNGGTRQLDAALVRLNGTGRDLATRRSFWRTRPSRFVQSRAVWLNYVNRFKPVLELHPWGRRSALRLKFVRCMLNAWVVYAGGASTRVCELFVFRCENGVTQGGYSGSPITLGNGVVAMHIAGEVIRGAGYSYAIPMYRILPKGALGRARLELASASIRRP